MNAQPPLVPRSALRLFVPRQRVEEIEGDLLELFHARVIDDGLRKARMRYWQDAASLIVGRLRLTRRIARPSTPSRPTFHRREVSPMLMAHQIVTELRVAARALATRPGYAGIAAFTLALGIGSNVAIFTVLNAVLLQPLPYPDPDRIVEIRHYAPGLDLPEVRTSAGLIEQYRKSAQTLMHVAGFDVRQLNLSGSGAPDRVHAVDATPELFSALAVTPALGRLFHDADADMHARRVVILTDGLWRTRFGGDRGVIGRMLQLDGEPVEIVGVMPVGFAFPDAETRLFIPRRIDQKEGFGAFGTTAIARLRPGATLAAAHTEISQLQQRIPEWFPGVTSQLLTQFRWSAAVLPWRERVVGEVSRTLWILFGTVGLVLLIAGANVANLFLVRAESRQREVAVRSALGASRGRLALTFFAEIIVLAGLGGVAGLLFAEAGTRLLVAYGPPRLPRLQDVRIDLTVVLFAVALTAISAAVLGLLPALRVARGASSGALRDGGRGTTAGRTRHRTRQTLIVVQVSMAVILLVSSGLTLRSAARLSAIDPGFRVDGLLTAGISVGAGADRARAIAFYQQVMDEMASVPGVTAVGAASTLPIAAGSVRGSGVYIRSRPTADNEVPRFSIYAAVTPGYFETLGAPLLQGRAPERADAVQDRKVAWVNSAFARQFLGDRVLGESISFRKGWLEIVGVVGDLRTFGLQEGVRPTVYVPLSNTTEQVEVMHAVIRSAGDPAALAPSLRRAVDRVDRSMPLTATRTMSDIIDASLAQTTFTMTLLAIAAGIALVLGVVGLYGVISYIVAQRTAEIGVRLALGARPGGVCLMVLRQGVVVAGVGVVVGLAGAWASTQLMASMLFEVSARDPLTFGGVALALMMVSVAATYIPARRAAGIDPVTALRDSA